MSALSASSRVVAAALLAFSANGCALLRVGDLETRVGVLETTRDALRQDIERDRKRLERLNHEASESSEFLRENGARFASRLDDLETSLRRTRGELEEIQHRLAGLIDKGSGQQAQLEQLRGRVNALIADLRDRAGIAILALPRELPERAEDWPVLAEKQFDLGEVRVAEAVARECQKRFVGSEPAANCGLMLAKIAYEEHRFGDAVDMYRAVHDSLGGKAVPVVGKALLGISLVMEAQGKCKDAVEVLKYLRTLLKKGLEQAEAKARLDDTKPRCEEGKVRLPAPTWGKDKPAPDAPAGQPAAPGAASDGKSDGAGKADSADSSDKAEPVNPDRTAPTPRKSSDTQPQP